MIPSKKLSQLKISSKAKLIGFEDDVLGNRLVEMGWIPGENISIENISPFGGPLIVSIGNNRYTIRKAEAQLINCELYD